MSTTTEHATAEQIEQARQEARLHLLRLIVRCDPNKAGNAASLATAYATLDGHAGKSASSNGKAPRSA